MAGPGGRRLRRTGGRVGLAGVVLLASLWVFSEPALRLGADVFAGDVEDEGLPAWSSHRWSSSRTTSGSRTCPAAPGGGDPRRDPRPPRAAGGGGRGLHRFWEHSGWDGTGIARAVFANVAARGVEEGGSTISQQLAKQNFTDSERTVVRKGKELLYAVALEERYTKRQLLQRYLNEVYLGSGAYGVAAAAREYFGVPITELRPEQAAVLVGLIRSPGALDPRRNPDAAKARRDVVLGIVAERGVLDRAEVDLLRATPLELAPPPVRVTDPLLAAAVHRDAAGGAPLGADADARAARLATGGLRIETSIDGRFQLAAVGAVQRALERWPGLGGALAAVDPQTGAVRAIASVTPPGTEDFDLATQGRRQPGSTFKPLAAVAALEAGLDQRQRLEGDGPAEFEHAPGQRWTVENYGGRNHGSVTLHDALSASVNTAFAQIAVSVGTGPIVDVADRLGIDVEAALGGPDQRGPSIALGGPGRGVSPLEMASAYGFLSTGGTHNEARIVTRCGGAGRHGRARQGPGGRAGGRPGDHRRSPAPCCRTWSATAPAAGRSSPVGSRPARPAPARTTPTPGSSVPSRRSRWPRGSAIPTPRNPSRASPAARQLHRSGTTSSQPSWRASTRSPSPRLPRWPTGPRSTSSTPCGSTVTPLSRSRSRRPPQPRRRPPHPPGPASRHPSEEGARTRSALTGGQVRRRASPRSRRATCCRR